MIFIYALKCPLSGTPRYVGKTQNPDTRLKCHISKAMTGQTSHHCARWIRNLIEQGLEPIFEVIFEVPANEEWQVHEKRLIAEYLDNGFELTNLTGGGGGFYKANPELLARRGASISRQRLEPEYNAKFRALMKEVQSRPSTRAARSQSIKDFWQVEGNRESIVAAMNTPEAKQRRSDATRRRYDDPDYAKADRERKRAAFQADPARREQLRQAILKRWSDYRAIKQEAQKP